MSLGAETLTDDQLLELLREACNSLAQRSPLVRNLAQQVIVDERQKLNILEGAIKGAIDQARAEYVAGIQTEVAILVREAVQNGTLRLMSAEQEAQQIVESETKARRAMIEEARLKAQLATWTQNLLRGRPTSIGLGDQIKVRPPAPEVIFLRLRPNKQSYVIGDSVGADVFFAGPVDVVEVAIQVQSPFPATMNPMMVTIERLNYQHFASLDPRASGLRPDYYFYDGVQGWLGSNLHFWPICTQETLVGLTLAPI